MYKGRHPLKIPRLRMVSRVEQKLSAGVARLIIEKDLVRRGGSAETTALVRWGDADHIAR